MQCKLCNIEPRITQVKNQMIEDKPYTVQVLACNNPQCPNYQKEIGELRHDFLEPENKVIEIEY